MADRSVAKKLGIKPGFQGLVINAPDGYLGLLDPLLDDVSISTGRDGSTTYDYVQAFVHNRADVEKYAKDAIDAVKVGGLLWLTFPKKSGKIKTDISRDEGWDVVHAAGWQGVTLISVDDTWSAMRYRPRADIKSRNR